LDSNMPHRWLLLLAPTHCSAALRNPFRAAPTHFDYIIVGGGTAGCVLADRLSAASKQVLVLEPGPSPAAELKIAAPVALTKLFGSEYDWGFRSAPTPGTAGREVHLCRGKCLGGSSATNALLYLRGTAADFDGWGLDGWGSEAMLASFLAVEAQRDAAFRTDSLHHGSGGAVPAETPRYANPLSERFLEAAAQAGHPFNADFNDWSRPQAGVGRFQLTTRRGRRAHSAATHLRRAARRPNLHVRCGCAATRLVLSAEGGGGGGRGRTRRSPTRRRGAPSESST